MKYTPTINNSIFSRKRELLKEEELDDRSNKRQLDEKGPYEYNGYSHMPGHPYPYAMYNPMMAFPLIPLVPYTSSIKHGPLPINPPPTHQPHFKINQTQSHIPMLQPMIYPMPYSNPFPYFDPRLSIAPLFNPLFSIPQYNTLNPPSTQTNIQQNTDSKVEENAFYNVVDVIEIETTNHSN